MKVVLRLPLSVGLLSVHFWRDVGRQLVDRLPTTYNCKMGAIVHNY